jgi:hypothetical protein
MTISSGDLEANIDCPVGGREIPNTASGYASSCRATIRTVFFLSSLDEDESGEARAPVRPNEFLRRNMMDLGLSPVEIDEPDTRDGVLAGSNIGPRDGGGIPGLPW